MYLFFIVDVVSMMYQIFANLLQKSDLCTVFFGLILFAFETEQLTNFMKG